MMRTDVAIIGGGLAGLTAAHLLHRAGVDFQLYEARDRLGGRILTTDATGPSGATGFDLGPSWVWPAAQPAIAGLLSDLGLETFAQASAGDLVFERVLHQRPGRFAAMQADPAIRRIAGGVGALIAALARGLPPARLHLDTPVSRLDHGPDGVTLSLPGRTVTARHVLAALPPRLLAGRIAFVPELPAATVAGWRATPTWMASHAKFVAVYARPFWRDSGLSGMAQSLVGPMVEIHDATSRDGAAALFGFLGIGATDRARLDETAMRASCVAQLVRLFGAEATTPRATLYKDWAADPWTATADDLHSAGHPNAPTACTDGPWADAVVLAGSETSARDAGYLSGAVIAATRAVATVIAGNESAPFA